MGMFRNQGIFQGTALFCAAVFIFTSAAGEVLPAACAQEIVADLSRLVSVSSAQSLPVLRGLRLDRNDPFKIDFVIDTADQKQVSRQDVDRLIRYFLAGLTIPEKDLWVNLSPFEEERVVPESLGLTDMGRDLLNQDYFLKQLLSSLTCPDNATGKDFWDKTYREIFKTAGTTNVPIDTFKKIWIMPDNAEVFEGNDTALITQANLKVMMERDYLAGAHAHKSASAQVNTTNNGQRLAADAAAERVMKEVVLPKISRDVNSGANFAQLRQIYYSLILAAWFKKRFRESFYRAYIDKNKVSGIDLRDKNVKQKIYRQYLAAFKQGLYDYTKREYDQFSKKTVNRRYYSGGMVFSGLSAGLGSRSGRLGPVVFGQKLEVTTVRFLPRFAQGSSAMNGYYGSRDDNYFFLPGGSDGAKEIELTRDEKRSGDREFSYDIARADREMGRFSGILENNTYKIEAILPAKGISSLEFLPVQESIIQWLLKRAESKGRGLEIMTYSWDTARLLSGLPGSGYGRIQMGKVTEQIYGASVKWEWKDAVGLTARQMYVNQGPVKVHDSQGQSIEIELMPVIGGQDSAARITKSTKPDWIGQTVIIKDEKHILDAGNKVLGEIYGLDDPVKFVLAASAMPADAEKLVQLYSDPAHPQGVFRYPDIAKGVKEVLAGRFSKRAPDLLISIVRWLGTDKVGELFYQERNKPAEQLQLLMDTLFSNIEKRTRTSDSLIMSAWFSPTSASSYPDMWVDFRGVLTEPEAVKWFDDNSERLKTLMRDGRRCDFLYQGYLAQGAAARKDYLRRQLRELLSDSAIPEFEVRDTVPDLTGQRVIAATADKESYLRGLKNAADWVGPALPFFLGGDFGIEVVQAFSEPELRKKLADFPPDSLLCVVIVNDREKEKQIQDNMSDAKSKKNLRFREVLYRVILDKAGKLKANLASLWNADQTSLVLNDEDVIVGEFNRSFDFLAEFQYYPDKNIDAITFGPVALNSNIDFKTAIGEDEDLVNQAEESLAQAVTAITKIIRNIYPDTRIFVSTLGLTRAPLIQLCRELNMPERLFGITGDRIIGYDYTIISSGGYDFTAQGEAEFHKTIRDMHNKIGLLSNGWVNMASTEAEALGMMDQAIRVGYTSGKVALKDTQEGRDFELIPDSRDKGVFRVNIPGKGMVRDSRVVISVEPGEVALRDLQLGEYASLGFVTAVKNYARDLARVFSKPFDDRTTNSLPASVNNSGEKKIALDLIGINPQPTASAMAAPGGITLQDIAISVDPLSSEFSLPDLDLSQLQGFSFKVIKTQQLKDPEEFFSSL